MKLTKLFGTLLFVIAFVGNVMGQINLIDGNPGWPGMKITPLGDGIFIIESGKDHPINISGISPIPTTIKGEYFKCSYETVYTTTIDDAVYVRITNSCIESQKTSFPSGSSSEDPSEDPADDNPAYLINEDANGCYTINVGSGTVTIPEGAEICVNDINFSSGGKLINNGTLNFNKSYTFKQDEATFTNNGTLNFKNVDFKYVGNKKNDFTNNGEIYCSNCTFIVENGNPNGGVAMFKNNNTIVVDNTGYTDKYVAFGTENKDVTFSKTGNIEGSSTNVYFSSNSTLDVKNSNLTLTSRSTFYCNGGVNIDTGKVLLNLTQGGNTIDIPSTGGFVTKNSTVEVKNSAQYVKNEGVLILDKLLSANIYQNEVNLSGSGIFFITEVDASQKDIKLAGGVTLHLCTNPTKNGKDKFGMMSPTSQLLYPKNEWISSDPIREGDIKIENYGYYPEVDAGTKSTIENVIKSNSQMLNPKYTSKEECKKEIPILLPVDTIIVKQVRNQGNVVSLSWSVEGKIENVPIYYIYRSIDGINFDMIGQTKNLNFQDKEVPSNMMLYYKIGCNEGKTSKIVSVYSGSYNPCEDETLYKFQYGPEIYRVYEGTLIRCENDN